MTRYEKVLIFERVLCVYFTHATHARFIQTFSHYAQNVKDSLKCWLFERGACATHAYTHYTRSFSYLLCIEMFFAFPFFPASFGRERNERV